MFNMGWTELLVIGVVALIVIGPQDLPEMFRQLGRFTGKIRAMGREFQRAMDQAAKESGASDVAKDLKTMTSPKALGLDAVKEAADRFEKWDPMKPAKPAAKPAAKADAKADAKGDTKGGEAKVDPVPETAGPASVTASGTAAGAAKHGPATQALVDKQAARKAVIAETSAKLKAIDEGAAPAKAAAKSAAKAKAPAKTAAKTAAKAPAKAPAKAAAASTAAKPAGEAAPKPRAPRKKKADEA